MEVERWRYCGECNASDCRVGGSDAHCVDVVVEEERDESCGCIHLVN